MSRNYVTIDVDVYLDEFDDDTLIEELEDRGYMVVEGESDEDQRLTEEEIDVILKLLTVHDVGTTEYSIYEKLRKR